MIFKGEKLMLGTQEYIVSERREDGTLILVLGDQYINKRQLKLIKSYVKARVYRLLLIAAEQHPTWLRDSYFTQTFIDIYSPTFYKRCYSDVAKLGHLGSPVSRTTVDNFRAALDDIKNWSPDGGIEAMMASAESRLHMRKERE